ncbi:MAG TPA: peroxide stress protein YaaA [Tissierellaceae bacterium]
MRIIISPAKKMKVDNDVLLHKSMPIFIDEAQELLNYMRKLTYDELKSLWKCNDSIARLNYGRIRNMDLYNNLTPAILSYEGIQYQYMAPGVFEYEELDYIEEHLRILSGFYGVLRPFDGVAPYRLEMQAKPINWKYKSLYEFWGDKIANELFNESRLILNLASKEYSKCVSCYLKKDIRFVTCVFGELINGKVVEKGTLVKMARGEMVRFMAENKIIDIEDIKAFNRLGYVFKEELSDESNFVFIKEADNNSIDEEWNDD